MSLFTDKHLVCLQTSRSVAVGPQVEPSQILSALQIICLFREAPSLHHILDTDPLKSLSATCRVLRSWFIAQVRIITVQDCRDIDTKHKAKWSNLVEIQHPAWVILKTSPKFLSLFSPWAKTLPMHWEPLPVA